MLPYLASDVKNKIYSFLDGKRKKSNKKKKSKKMKRKSKSIKKKSKKMMKRI